MTIHPIRPETPPHRQAHGPIARTLGRLWLWAFGFRVGGRRPPVEKYVMICAPHTSNWDAFFMLAASFVLDMKLSWMLKDDIVKGWFGRFLRSVGAVPINRRSPQNMVEQMASAFRTTDALVLAVPPEGTRKRTDCWKSGFYYIALKAGVPIVPAVLDYGKRVATVHPPFMPTGDIDADLGVLAALYDRSMAKFPEKFGPIVIRSTTEDAARAVAG